MHDSATIEETVTRLVADVDWTDECQVLLHLRKRTNRLTPSQARRIAAALTRCADAADNAAASTVRVVEPTAFDMLGGLPSNLTDQVTTIARDLGATIIHDEHLSPDCAAGKHPHNWQDMAWDDDADVEVPCECSCHLISSTPGRAA